VKLRSRSNGSILSRSLGVLTAGIRFLFWMVLIAWCTLAIYYSNLPWAGLRLGMAAVFAAFAIWALWLSRRRHMPALVMLLFLGVVAWWMTIQPSHDRQWRPEVAVMPRAFIDGDRVRLTGGATSTIAASMTSRRTMRSVRCCCPT